jgi:hypothetical protein
VPEAPPGGTRPLVKESLREDLPSLKAEMEVSTKQTRARIGKELEAYRSSQASPVASLLNKILDHSRKEREQQREKEKQVQARADGVAKLLGRRLTGPERSLVGVMVEQGKSPEEMAKILKELPSAPPKP